MQHRDEFRQRLADSGFLSFYLAFGPGNKRIDDWKNRVAGIDRPLKNLVELFLLNEKLETTQVAELLGENVFNELVDEEILATENGQTGTDKYTLGTYHSLLFFFEFSIYPAVYFGNDSIALGVYQHPCPRGVVLDLCSGTGIQAMIAALQADHVDAVEISDRAARTANFNVRLNYLEDNVRVHNDSFSDFAAQSNGSYDRIVFNPPLLPVPEVLHYPLAGDGGGDGLEISEEILNLYLPKLSQRGTIEFIGCGLGRDGQATFIDQLRKIFETHGASARVLLLGKSELKRGDFAYESTVATAAVTSSISVEVCHNVYDLHLQKLDRNEMYSFFVRVQKGNGDKPRTDVMNFANGSCNWFV